MTLYHTLLVCRGWLILIKALFSFLENVLFSPTAYIYQIQADVNTSFGFHSYFTYQMSFLSKEYEGSDQQQK